MREAIARGLLVGLGLCAGAGLAMAQKPPAKPAPKADPALVAAAQKIAGTFLLSSADGTRTCPMTLRADPAASGFALGIDAPACTAIAFSQQIAAWVPDGSGGLRLVSAQGKLVAEFTSASEGSYEALRDGDGVYFLANPAAQEQAALSIDDMTGDWALARTAGAPICHWTLTADPAPGGGLMVRVAPGCDPGLMTFAPSSWRIDGGTVLVASGSGAPTLRFARQEDGGWAKIPERGRPLLMSRP